ncbi:MAG: RHS repeat-associated core domain-containing protein, partial [Candidatus Delongbacteria bacterium]|nr:RHS repeat-associated core domain-containing protein [Candidatus Delongbacteria bacterium]
GELWIEKEADGFDLLPFKYTGLEFDKESNLYYASKRYFSPKTGIWLSADPAGGELINPNRQGFSIVESTNWYSYCSNNPVNYIDPTGFGTEDPEYKWSGSTTFAFSGTTAVTNNIIINDTSYNLNTKVEKFEAFKRPSLITGAFTMTGTITTTNVTVNDGSESSSDFVHIKVTYQIKDLSIFGMFSGDKTKSFSMVFDDSVYNEINALIKSDILKKIDTNETLDGIITTIAIGKSLFLSPLIDLVTGNALDNAEFNEVSTDEAKQIDKVVDATLTDED